MVSVERAMRSLFYLNRSPHHGLEGLAFILHGSALLYVLVQGLTSYL